MEQFVLCDFKGKIHGNLCKTLEKHVKKSLESLWKSLEVFHTFVASRGASHGCACRAAAWCVRRACLGPTRRNDAQHCTAPLGHKICLKGHYAVRAALPLASLAQRWHSTEGSARRTTGACKKMGRQAGRLPLIKNTT